MNNLMLYVEENLLYLPDRCYGMDEVSDSTSEKRLQNLINVPLISPQSTLDISRLRPPPGLSLPTEYSPATVEKSLQHNFLNDFVKTADTPCFNIKKASTNPFLQDDTTCDVLNMTPRMFMELWNSNLQLQMQITSALNALLLNASADSVQSSNLALATEQAVKCEQHINSILHLFGGMNFNDNISSTPKTPLNDTSFVDPWLKTANRQDTHTPVAIFQTYINESSATSASYAPVTSLFANETMNDSAPYDRTVLNGQSCPIPISNSTTNITFMNDNMKVDPAFSTNFQVSTVHTNANAADTIYPNSESVNELNFNSVHLNSITSQCKEYGTKMKPLFAIDKPRIDKISPIASPLVTEKGTHNLSYQNEFADIWLQKEVPVRKETNPFKLSMSSEETPSVISPIKRSSEQTAKQAVQKSIKDYFTNVEPLFTGREHECPKAEIISKIFNDPPIVTYNIIETEEERTQDPQKYHEVSLPCQEQTIDWSVSKTAVKELNSNESNLRLTNHFFDTLDRNYPASEGRSISTSALLVDNPNLDDEGYLTRPSTSHTSESSPPLFSMQTINETKYNENLPVDAFKETSTPSAEAWMKSVENTVKSWKKEEAGLSQNQFIGENFVSCQQPAISMNQQFTYDRDLISLKNITTECSGNLGFDGAKVEASSPLEQDPLHKEDQKCAWKASALTEEQSCNYRSFQLSSISVENYLFFQAIELTKRVVYVFHYCWEGWISTDEFVEAFTEFKTPSYMISLLDILDVNVPFKELRRSEYPLEFSQLESTPITVTRDANNKINKLHLLPLKSALKILRKLRIVSREDVDNAVVKKEFVHGTIIHEIWTLINAYGGLRRLVDEELNEK